MRRLVEGKDPLGRIFKHDFPNISADLGDCRSHLERTWPLLRLSQTKESLQGCPFDRGSRSNGQH